METGLARSWSSRALMVVACVSFGGLMVGSAAEGADNSVPVALEDEGLFGARQALAGPGATRGDSFGAMVAISGDTSLVGQYFKPGGVSVLQRTGTTWERTDRLLVGSDGTDQVVEGEIKPGRFDLSDELMVLTSERVPADDDPLRIGPLRVTTLERSGGEWVSLAAPSLSHPAGTVWQATGVSVSGDAFLMSVTTFTPDYGGDYVVGDLLVGFHRTSTGWQQETFPAPPGSHIRGELSGARALISYDDPTEPQVDTAVYVRNGSSWSLEQVLPVHASQEEGGVGLAIDGDLLAVGDGTYGRVLVFQHSGGSWVSQPGPQRHPKGLYFGSDLALDGDTLVVGDWLFEPGRGRGGAWVFTRDGRDWTQQTFVESSNAASSTGYAVDVSDDTALVGEPMFDAGTPGRAVFANTSPYSVEDGELAVVAPGVLANDTDADGDRLTAALVSGPQHGDVRLRSDGSFAYTADSGYSGPDRFAYRASDGQAWSPPAAVLLRVAAPGVPPGPTAPPIPHPETAGNGTPALSPSAAPSDSPSTSASASPEPASPSASASDTVGEIAGPPDDAQPAADETSVPIAAFAGLVALALLGVGGALAWSRRNS